MFMQDKSKNVYLTENELKSQIKSGCFPSCYLIFGEEHYLIKNYLDRIISTAVEGFEDFNLNKFDGNVKIQEVYDATQSFPMLASRRVVTLCDFPFDKAPVTETERLLTMINDMPSTTVFVMWYETVEITEKKPGEKFNKLFKAVNSAGGAVCYLGRRSDTEIFKILQSGAARRKCIMDLNTARAMVESCSDDLGTLVNELEKLCLYVGEGGTITVETVNMVCSRSVEASVYNVSKAVLRNDLAGAMQLLDDLFYMNTDPVYILTLLSSAYVDIFRVFAAQSLGLRKDTVAKDFGYGNMAFRLNDAERNMRKFTEQQLVESLKVLQGTDRLLKTSRADSKTVLETAMVNLIRIGQGNGK